MPALASRLADSTDHKSRTPPLAVAWAILFLALVVTVTVLNRECFFRTALYEEGDDAANALQIYRAKHFQELHGNYSRWGFHHPGPAFFYVYAAGEWLLHDVAPIAPTPHNAHIYAATVLQLAFYAAAIALAMRHARQPLLIAALLVLAGAAHYIHVERPFFSVWPPDVLLMPFLCFLVASAAVAVGDRAALPFFALSAGFLVHGHIAQPLFVAPLTLFAIGSFWRREGNSGFRAAARSGIGLFTFALTALLLLPIGLDLLKGRQSNVHDILLHLRFQTDAGQTLWQSFLCYASYFFALKDPSIFNELTSASYAPFREHTLVLAGCAAFFVLITWRLYRRTARSATAPAEFRFGRALLVCWLLGSALTLVWGMRQDGGLTSFNSLFNHSLVHALAVAGIVSLAPLLPPVRRWLGASAIFTAVVLFAGAMPFQPAIGSRGDELNSRLHGAQLADPKPNAPKLITFPPEEWYEAVMLARVFQRQGIPFYVHPTWRIMFGEDKLLTDSTALNRGELSTWHVIARSHAPVGAHVLNRQCAVVFPDTATLPPWPARIDFGANDTTSLPRFGLGTSTEDWVWTEGRFVALQYRTPTASRDVEVTVDASAFVTPLTPPAQHATLLVNGEPVGTEVFDTNRRQAHWIVPQAQWNRRSPGILSLELPDAISPAALGLSADQRLLGLRLYRVTLQPVSR